MTAKAFIAINWLKNKSFLPFISAELAVIFTLKNMGQSKSFLGPASGRVGPVIYYQLPGSDKTYVRSVPVSNRNARKHHPRYERTRQENAEFRGCVLGAKHIARAVAPIRQLGDYNSFGDLVKICKLVQQSDAASEEGKRSVLFSRAATFLNGFSFNKRKNFESFVRQGSNIEVNRHNGFASIFIPNMKPEIHFLNPAKLPFARIVFSLGKICDLKLSQSGIQYETADAEEPGCVVAYTEWTNTRTTFPETSLQIGYRGWVDLEHRTLVAGLGIEFGVPGPGGEYEMVKYAGAGKICSALGAY